LQVTIQEFINYYSNLGANIDNEDYFELMIRNAWHIPDGEIASLNNSMKRLVVVTHTDGTQHVKELLQDPMIKRPATASANIGSRSNVDTSSGLSYSYQNKGRRSSTAFNATSEAALAAFVPSLAGVVPVPKKNHLHPVTTPEPTAAVRVLIDKLKHEIALRGAHGFTGLQRKFRIIDDDGDRLINLMEFKKSLKEMSMSLADSEMRLLFEHFDADHSGSIDFDEFIQGIRDPLTERRLSLVKEAFLKLDRDNNGMVDATEVASLYDASKHPEVIAGRKTSQQVVQ
jgi:hypothetical protein